MLKHTEGKKRMTIEFQKETLELEIGELNLCFETGVIARQASGSVILRANDTMLFSAVTAKTEAEDTIDFFPLRVNI
jgi:polyribonucleotide nucleotidyltransferase